MPLDSKHSKASFFCARGNKHMVHLGRGGKAREVATYSKSEFYHYVETTTWLYSFFSRLETRENNSDDTLLLVHAYTILAEGAHTHAQSMLILT